MSRSKKVHLARSIRVTSDNPNMGVETVRSIPYCSTSNQNGVATPRMTVKEKDVDCRHCLRMMESARLRASISEQKKFSTFLGRMSSRR